MAYNEDLAGRLRKMLLHKPGVAEKAMFGGLSFLLNGKMFCGVLKDNLVVRVKPEDSDALLKLPDVKPMNFTGKPMKGFLYVGPKSYGKDAELAMWAARGMAYVKSLPKKK